ncbi:response regulator transcription factor [Tissierella sp. Yu-01]|uniref:response regulator n=1 Tax=Tissierella sp. Yu-01 TaxID=3035694 RepID=UPI00240D0099|nr:response regulator transcription factor [Tissierella sp. Yu-01]WFA08753.1 response regulator transcription factor [Tissierella sp. Yu-01]
MINLAIVDDQSIMREGLSFMLSKRDNFKVMGTGENGRDAYELCINNHIDVMLLDIKMPLMDGVEATKLIKRDFPHTNIIILTTFNDDEYIFDALKYGASGYLLKDATIEKIVEAILEAHNGGVLIQPNVAKKMVDMFSQMTPDEVEIDKRVNDLTEREKDIMRRLGEGMSNKEIAKSLFISEGTVKNHITSILNKLDLRDRTQLALFAVKNHII